MSLLVRSKFRIYLTKETFQGTVDFSVCLCMKKNTFSFGYLRKLQYLCSHDEENDVDGGGDAGLRGLHQAKDRGRPGRPVVAED